MSQYSPRVLPESLQGLVTLALDLRWSWHHGADKLWRAVDTQLWDATENPWLILESLTSQRISNLAQDSVFLAALQQQLAARQAHLNSESWFPSKYGDSFSGQIAYFSMEFGISESLPIYAGGLGVLAGDYLKTACDLNVPLIGIGLLYQQGYFRQVLNANGEQIEFYPFNDPTMLPVVPLRTENGEWVRINVELPGRSLLLRAWHAQVGRRTLLLLDSNDLRNDAGDRGITSELYGGGLELRLQQEIVLGIGGYRLLEALGIDCAVCHFNEGHAAFAVLERARHFMTRTGESFDVALRATRAGNLFTTHTPVAAGFDRFAPDLLALYFSDYARALNVEMNDVLALGRSNAADASESFNMAYLALRGAGAVNGVSRLHGEVSRRIFQPLFPRWPQNQVPVGHVTNGVHAPTWDSAAADALWTDVCGKSRWRGSLDSVETNVLAASDEALWNIRSEGRRRLVEFLEVRLTRQHRGRGIGVEKLPEEMFDSDVLTLGFARRFAEYKRTNLLLKDPQRLLDLLCHRDRPVQLVIAGKAHPSDAEGKALLRQWQDFLDQAEVRGRVVFVEDYDLVVAGYLTQGVDVWINTPRRPWEASGTSGMKILVNGGLNVSVLDGWWAEAYTPQVGWAVGNGCEHADTDTADAKEAEALYEILENEVIPGFYRRDQSGLPREWLSRVRKSMASLTAQFSSNRMLREYVETYYIPLAESYRQRAAGSAGAIQDWYQQLQQGWHRMHFGTITSTLTDSGNRIDVQAYLNGVSADAVRVELYADSTPGGTPTCETMECGGPLAGAANGYTYHCTVPVGRRASDYTPRIVPAHDAAIVPLEANFILWYR